MGSSGEFYVYGLVDPRNNEVFYIGKGINDRINRHVKEITEIEKSGDKRKDGINENKLYRIKEILESGFELNYKFFGRNLSEDYAYALEEILIERFGRKGFTTGKLLNISRGGRREYPDDEIKVSEDDVINKFPELLDILQGYPKISEKIVYVHPLKRKIRKKFALYQYSLEGQYIDVHHTRDMRYATGMSWRIIDKCIEENSGYAYGFQWSREKVDSMQNILELDDEEVNRLKTFKNWIKKEVTDLELKKLYDNRVREVEE